MSLGDDIVLLHSNEDEVTRVLLSPEPQNVVQILDTQRLKWEPGLLNCIQF